MKTLRWRLTAFKFSKSYKGIRSDCSDDLVKSKSQSVASNISSKNIKDDGVRSKVSIKKPARKIPIPGKSSYKRKRK